MRQIDKQVLCRQPRQHVKIKVETIEGVNEYGEPYVFQRKTCEDCNEFLGDVVVEKEK